MKRTLNILIILLVLDLAGVGVLWYVYSSTTDVKTQETDLMEQLDQEGQKGKKLSELRQTLASAGKQRNELEKFLIDPSDENQIPLLNSFEQLGASTTGATVNVSRFEVAEGSPRKIVADTSLSGSWDEVYRFLRLIEEYPSRMNITKFATNLVPPTITPDMKTPEDVWSGSISFELAGLRQSKN